MSDLDAELLALAGGDDSSDEESSGTALQKQASPRQTSTSDQKQSTSSSDMARKGVARPVKRRKRDLEDGEEEEGELYVISILIPSCCVGTSLDRAIKPPLSFISLSLLLWFQFCVLLHYL